MAILFLIFYPSTLNFLRLPKNNEPPIIARIPPTHPNAGIKPTAPPTIRRTEGADTTSTMTTDILPMLSQTVQGMKQGRHPALVNITLYTHSQNSFYLVISNIASF